MAKNKNRDRKIQAGSNAERSAQEARTSSMEAQSERRDTQVPPTSVAHKGRQKRFGHN
ncbi:hypothetical protein ABZ729_12730 [Streptomyces sp. NPDC006678]|uniref:hypothetical protein n=1 Tax=Streptomyces sp. NPDC006678 TaxID=3157185 RepID=UPI0033EC73F2